jgi:hypothetical protein
MSLTYQVVINANAATVGDSTYSLQLADTFFGGPEVQAVLGGDKIISAIVIGGSYESFPVGSNVSGYFYNPISKFGSYILFSMTGDIGGFDILILLTLQRG